MKMKLKESDINAIITESIRNVLSEVSFKLADSARNSAIKRMINSYHSYNDDEYGKIDKYATQYYKFLTYANEMLQKIVGTKVRISLMKYISMRAADTEDNPTHLLVDYGLIESIKPVKGTRNSFDVVVVCLDEDISGRRINLIMNLGNSTSNNATPEWSCKGYDSCNVEFRNKKARQIVASLSNRKGDDTFLKPW